MGFRRRPSGEQRLSSELPARCAVPRDGGFPIKTPVPPASPATPLRQIETNDLRKLVATAPVLLCGGNAIPPCFFKYRSYPAILGNDTPKCRVTVLDLDSSGGPYADIKNAFRAAKDLIALECKRTWCRLTVAPRSVRSTNATLVPVLSHGGNVVLRRH